MESPDKYYTNIFRIESLARISYRVFVPNITPLRHGSLESDIPLWTRYAQSLRLAEKYLREHQIISYVDYEENEAWVFDIPIPSASDVEVQNVPFEAFVRLGLAEPKTTTSNDKSIPPEPPLKDFPPDCGMTLWKEGTFLASSLNPPPPMPPRTPVTIELSGADDSKTDEGSEEDTPERVWQFLTGAVLSSLSYQLAQTAKFIPLNLRDYVSLPHVQFPEPDDEVFADELWYSEYIGKVVMSINVHMASSGVLIVSTNSRLMKGFGQLIHCMEDNNPVAGRSIWLAPWGQVGQAVAVLSEKELSSFRAQEWKRNVAEYLQSKGLPTYRKELGLDGAWIRVNLRREDIDGVGHEEETLWPASLCYVREHEGDLTLSETPDIPTSIGFARNPLGALYHEFYKDVYDPDGEEEAEMKRLEQGMKDLLERTPVPQRHGLEMTNDTRILRYEEDTGIGWFQYEGNTPPDPLGYVMKIADEGGGGEAVMQLLRGEPIAPGNIGHDASKDKGKSKAPVREAPMPPPTPAAAYPTPSAVYPTPPTAPHTHQSTARHESTVNEDTNIPTNSGQMDVDDDEPDWLTESPAKKSEGDIKDDVLEDLMEGDAFVTDQDFDFFDEPTAQEGENDNIGLDAIGFEPMSEAIERSPDPDTSMIDMAPTREEHVPVLGTDIYEESHPPTSQQPEPVEYAQTPPISPHHAMTLLIPEYSSAQQQQTSPAYEGQPSSALEHRKSSLYAPMNFLPNVEQADKKYQAGGRFYVPPEQVMEELEASTTKITLDSPVNTTKGSSIQTPTPRFTGLTPGTDKMFSSDESDSTDGYSGSSSEDDEADSGYPPSGKRKRDEQDIDGLFGDDDEEDLAGNISELLPWQLLIPDPNDASLIPVFNTLDLHHLSCADLIDPDFMTCAKLVADQLMGSFIQPLWRDYSIGIDDSGLKSEVLDRKVTDESIVYTALIELFPQVLKCTLENYATIQDAIPDRSTTRSVPPLRRPPLRTVGSTLNVPSGTSSPITDTPPAQSIFRVEPPHVHVHRGEYALDILPASLHYWETFSFAPCVGSKNVFAFCVYPDGGVVMEEAVDAFLDNVGPLYDACRLGLHLPVDLPAEHGFPEVVKGRVPWKIPGPRPTVSTAMESLFQLSGELGVHLMSIADEGQNIVIYIVNPFRHPSALGDIARAFVRLKRSYKTAMDNARRRPNNLVLQIIPASWVVAPDSLVVLSFEKARILCMEVYNRCNLSLEKLGPGEYADLPPPSSPFAANHPITIVKPLANSIEFKLTAEPSPALLMENSFMHVAYATSLDERWIVAAWSDNWGKIKRTECYCLARQRHQPFRGWKEVYREIWRATMEVIRFKNVHWRLVFTKVGTPVTEEEVEEWTELQKSPVVNFAMRTPSVIVLSCTLSPDLSISPPVQPPDWTTLGLPADPQDWPKEPPAGLNDLLKDIDAEVQVRNSWKARHKEGAFYKPKSFLEIFRQLEETRRKTSGVATSSDAAGGSGGKGKAPESEKKNKVIPSDPSTWPEIDPSEIDASTTTLIDLADETWGVILSHKTPCHAAITEFGPITTTAYQVCKGHPSARDRHAVIQFNVVGWVNVNTSATTVAQNERDLAREILEGWRGLRFLDWGQRRGVPWHVAAVEKGVGIGEVM